MIRTFALCSCLVASLAAADPQPIADRLTSNERFVKVGALTDLAHQGPTSAREMELARDCLADNDPAIRLAAAGVVARLKDEGAVPQLIEAMRQADPASANDLRCALKAIAGIDAGGTDPEAWSDWRENITAMTDKGVAEVRSAIAEGNEAKARAALHPLLMQRAGRDSLVNLLEELAGGDNPRLASLAREGLVAIDTASSRLALAGLGPKTVQEKASQESRVAQSPGIRIGALTLPGPATLSSGVSAWTWICGLAVLTGLFAMFLTSKRMKPAIRKGTQRLSRRATHRITRRHSKRYSKRHSGAFSLKLSDRN